MVHSGVLYIYERRRGPPNVVGPGVAYPLPHPLDGPDNQVCTIHSARSRTHGKGQRDINSSNFGLTIHEDSTLLGHSINTPHSHVDRS